MTFDRDFNCDDEDMSDISTVAESGFSVIDHDGYYTSEFDDDEFQPTADVFHEYD